MRNLLSANFLRLRKSMLFWGCLILMLLLGAGFSLYCFLDRRTYETFGVGYVSNLDPVLFRYALLIGILMAVFVPLFFGMEYSDGAIRNWARHRSPCLCCPRWHWWRRSPRCTPS